MTALVVLEGERPAVLSPGELAIRVRVREQGVVDDDLLFRVNQKQDRLIDVEHIAWLGIEQRRVLWLELILWRRLDVVDLPPVPRSDATGCNPLRIGRPRDRRELVVVGFRSVRAQARQRPRARLADGEIVVVDE